MRISDWSSDVCSSDLVDDEESVNQAPISDDFKPRISAYDLLMRQSRKMGGLATRTYDVTKEFLKQDVSVLHPDRVLRSEERRVGKGWVSTCRSRGSRYH